MSKKNVKKLLLLPKRNKRYADTSDKTCMVSNVPKTSLNQVQVAVNVTWKIHKKEKLQENQDQEVGSKLKEENLLFFYRSTDPVFQSFQKEINARCR